MLTLQRHTAVPFHSLHRLLAFSGRAVRALASRAVPGQRSQHLTILSHSTMPPSYKACGVLALTFIRASALHLVQ